METKICSRCEQEMPATREYFSPSNKWRYKLESWCKKCKAAAQRERVKRYSEERKEQRRQYKKEWFRNNHDKIRDHEAKQMEAWHRTAHRIVRRYKDKYNLSFTVCSMCWSAWRMLTHHPNYNEPTKVIVVCDACHQAIHKWRLEEDLTKIVDLKELDSLAKAKSHQVR